MKQLSSMMVGFACSGSSTPPMPTPPDRCTFLPICAQEPTVAQGINHGAFVNVGADVNVGRHQHSVAGDERALAHGGRRRHAETFFWKRASS